eukprot:scpid54688/ scgid9834/ 
MMKGQQSANSNNNGLYQENRSVTGGEEYRLFSQHRGADYRSRLTEAEAPWQEGAIGKETIDSLSSISLDDDAAAHSSSFAEIIPGRQIWEPADGPTPAAPTERPAGPQGATAGPLESVFTSKWGLGGNDSAWLPLQHQHPHPPSQSMQAETGSSSGGGAGVAGASTSSSTSSRPAASAAAAAQPAAASFSPDGLSSFVSPRQSDSSTAHISMVERLLDSSNTFPDSDPAAFYQRVIGRTNFPPGQSAENAFAEGSSTSPVGVIGAGDASLISDTVTVGSVAAAAVPEEADAELLSRSFSDSALPIASDMAAATIAKGDAESSAPLPAAGSQRSARVEAQKAGGGVGVGAAVQDAVVQRTLSGTDVKVRDASSLASAPVPATVVVVPASPQRSRKSSSSAAAASSATGKPSSAPSSGQAPVETAATPGSIPSAPSSSAGVAPAVDTAGSGAEAGPQVALPQFGNMPQYQQVLDPSAMHAMQQQQQGQHLPPHMQQQQPAHQQHMQMPPHPFSLPPQVLPPFLLQSVAQQQQQQQLFLAMAQQQQQQQQKQDVSSAPLFPRYWCRELLSQVHLAEAVKPPLDPTEESVMVPYPAEVALNAACQCMLRDLLTAACELASKESSSFNSGISPTLTVFHVHAALTHSSRLDILSDRGLASLQP